MTDDTQNAVKSADRELWRETGGVGLEQYAPSIHVTAHGGIGINVGGTVIVKSLRGWHALAMVEELQGNAGKIALTH